MSRPRIARIGKQALALLGTISAVGGLFLISQHNYLLFHSLTELFSAVIGCAVFVIAWNGRQFYRNGYLLLLGVACFFVAGLDLLHALAYKGTGIFPGTDADLATQLWIAARCLESISLLVAPFFLNRRINAHMVVLGYGAVTFLVLLSIFVWRIFPECYVEGGGLTAFKRISEYVICLILGGAIFSLARLRHPFNRQVSRWLFISLGSMIASELAFTSYVSVYGLANFLGHCLKVAAFYCVYRALVQTCLREPLSMLLREVKQSEARLAAFTTASFEGIVESEDGRIVDCNEQFAQMVGWTVDDLKGRTIGDFMPPEERERVLANIQANQESTIEHNVIRKDGTVIVVEAHGRSASPDSRQRFTAVRDVTERKRAEAQLQANAARLAAVLEAQRQIAGASGDFPGFLNLSLECVSRLVGADGASLEIAQGDEMVYEAAVGLASGFVGLRLKTDGSLSGRSMTEGRLLRSDDIETDPRVDRRACRSIGLRSMMVIPLRYDEHSFGVLKIMSTRVSGFDGAAEDSLRMMGEFLGVTVARQRALEALRESEQRLKLATDATGYGTFDFYPQTGALIWSLHAKRHFGLGPDSAIDYNVFLRGLHPEDRERVDGIVKNVLRPECGGSYQTEYRTIGIEDGKERWILAMGRVFFDTDGRPVRFIGATVDITERKTFQAELERLVAERTARLQELVSELEHFSYTIAHDMRAPLRAMQGFSELVAQACANGELESTQILLQRIRAAAKRMDALIVDALSYSDAIRKQLPLAPVDPGPLICGMIDSYPELQGAHVRVEVQAQMPMVFGNEAGLTQVFSNLLTNAIKFAKPGLRAEIRVWAELRERQAEPPCNPLADFKPVSSTGFAPIPSVSAPSEGRSTQWVRIWVEDHGIGIPEELLPRVFNMFSRGSTQHSGTGIGLALVRKVVDRMGGRVGVESRLDEGSRFWIELKHVEPNQKGSGLS